MMFLIAILMLSSTVSGEKIKKCCPVNDVVATDVYDENLILTGELFNCVPSNDTKNFTEFSHQKFIGFNILVDYDSHWPPCGDQSLISKHLDGPTKVSHSASCVDMMDGKYFTFTCDEKLDTVNDFLEIVKLKKCCASGMSYDIFQRRCIENFNESNFSELLSDKTVLFDHEVLKCQENEAFVEYHSLVHGLKIRGNSLILTKTRPLGPEVIRNSFCIEATLNSEIENISSAQEHFGKKSRSKFIAKTCRDKSVCETMPCLQKCCPHGERFYHDGDKTVCEPHHTDVAIKFHDFNIDQSHLEPAALEPSEFGLLRHKNCAKYVLDVEEDGNYFHSGIDGSLFTPKYEKFYTSDEYCIDYFSYHDDEGPPQMHTFVCFSDDTPQQVQFQIYATLLAISAFFLALTFFVYIFLPKLLNLHGKTVVCHVISLLLGYTFLSAVQFATDVRLPFCLLIAFIVYFGLLSAFSWLNVMCLDIYWTFGSVRTHHGIRRTKEMKRFMYYSLYAWGFPFVLTIFTFMIDFYDILPKELKPNIGRSKCWFEKQSSPGHLIFFLLPIGIQISVNCVLFVLTAIHCNRIKAEIHRMQASDCSDQQRKKIFIADKAIFMMNIKLFSVMGISWLLEIMATLYNQSSMWWGISDVFNCLQGVLVFFVFVFKRKVLVAFQKKLGIRKMGLRAKTPTTLSTLDLNSTSVSRHNGRMMTKSSSAATLNTTLIKN